MTPPPDPSSYLDQATGDFLRSLEAMNNGFYAGMVSEDKTRVWDGDQLALQHQINVLADQLKADLEPQSITGGDEFEHLTLEQIRDLVYQIKPEVVQAVSEAWANIGSGMSEDAETARTSVVEGAIKNGWEGDGGRTAADTFTRVFNSVADIGRSASMVAMKIGFAQRGSDETFRMLTPLLQEMAPSGDAPILGVPVNLSPGASVPKPAIPELGQQQDADSQKEEARQAALGVLRNVYSPGIRGGDQAVPVLPTVYPAANPDGPVGPAPGPGPVAPGPGPSNPGGGDPNPGPAGNGDDPATNPAGDDDSGDNGNQAPGTQPSAAKPTGAQNPIAAPGSNTPDAASTTAAGFDPSSGLGGGTSGPGAGGGSGSGLGGGLPGAGGGLSGPGGATPRPGPGSAVPGGPAAPAAAPLGGMRAPGQPGSSGMPGMGPGMGGKGGKGEEEKDRESAEYLRGQHLEEWLDDGTRVMPAYGAIGENPPQAQPPAPPGSTSRPPSPPSRGRVPGEQR